MAIKNHFLDLWHKKERETGGYRISLSEIARDTGLSYSTLHRWKNDDVSRFDRPMLDALCDYFGCGVGDLLEYVPGDSAES